MIFLYFVLAILGVTIYVFIIRTVMDWLIGAHDPITKFIATFLYILLCVLPFFLMGWVAYKIGNPIIN